MNIKSFLLGSFLVLGMIPSFAQTSINYGRSESSSTQNSNDSAQAHAELAAGYYSAKQINIAKEEIKIALRLDPDLFLALYLSGLIASDENKFSDALSFFNRAHDVSPNHHDVYTAKGVLFCKQNEFDRGQTQFKYALNASPKTPSIQASILINSALCFQSSKQYASAKFALQQAQIEQPDNTGILFHLAQNSFLQNSLLESAQFLNEFHRLAPYNPSSLYLQWDIYRLIGNASGMNEAEQRILKEFSNSPQAKRIRQYNLFNSQ